MEYKCNLERLNKITQPDKDKISLCTKCKSIDCSNPIENMSISIFGIMTTIRVYVTTNSIFAVKNCDGYSIREDIDDEVEEE
jgi:hypothetical protein